jgi:hypothetical protein
MRSLAVRIFPSPCDQGNIINTNTSVINLTCEEKDSPCRKQARMLREVKHHLPSALLRHPRLTSSNTTPSTSIHQNY